MKKSLEETVNEFMNERVRVKERRQLWDEFAKKTIQLNLEKFAKAYPPLGATLGGHYDKKNYESVYLGMGSFPSGIEERNGPPQKYMYIGGALHFSQSINGEIIVWMEYPQIKDLADPKIVHEVFGAYEPELVSEEFVHSCLSDFITKQLKYPLEDDDWENRTRIGF